MQTFRQKDYVGDLVVNEKVIFYLLICFPFIQ